MYARAVRGLTVAYSVAFPTRTRNGGVDAGRRWVTGLTPTGYWMWPASRSASSSSPVVKTTFASATTAAGSEIVEYLLLGCALSVDLRADLFGETQEHFAANFDGQLGCVPGQIEAGRRAVAGDEDDVVGAEHLACVVAEVSNGHDLHVVTNMVTRYIVAPGATRGRRSVASRSSSRVTISVRQSISISRGSDRQPSGASMRICMLICMPSTSVRIDSATHRELKELAAQLGSKRRRDRGLGRAPAASGADRS